MTSRQKKTRLKESSDTDSTYENHLSQESVSLPPLSSSSTTKKTDDYNDYNFNSNEKNSSNNNTLNSNGSFLTDVNLENKSNSLKKEKLHKTISGTNENTSSKIQVSKENHDHINTEHSPPKRQPPPPAIPNFENRVGKWGKLRLAVVKNIAVEDIKFNGLEEPPIQVDYESATGLLLQSLNEDNVSFEQIKYITTAEESKHIINVMFWYAFCAFFQPDGLLLLHKELQSIGYFFARLYWKMLKKERFYMEMFHILISDIIIRALRKHFQQTDFIFSPQIEERIYKLVGLIITGIIPRMRFIHRIKNIIFKSEQKQKVSEYINAFQEALKERKFREKLEASSPQQSSPEIFKTMRPVKSPPSSRFPKEMISEFPEKKSQHSFRKFSSGRNSLIKPCEEPPSSRPTPRRPHLSSDNRLIKDYLTESLEEFFSLGSVDPEEASTTFWNLYTTSPLVASYVGVPVEFRMANRRKMKVQEGENTQKGGGTIRIRQIVDEIMESSGKSAVRHMMMSPRAEKGHATVTARDNELEAALKKLPLTQRVNHLLRRQQEMGRRFKRKQLWERPPSSMMFQQSLKELDKIEKQFRSRNDQIDQEERDKEDQVQREIRNMRNQYQNLENDPSKKRKLYTDIIQKHRRNFRVSRKNVDSFFTRGTAMAEVAMRNTKQMERHIHNAHSVFHKVEEYKNNARKSSFRQKQRQKNHSSDSSTNLSSSKKRRPRSKLLDELEIDI
eukprot:gb/GECH01006283.1/.p1 GENE.gb/GECH01006283.1/~~gb/GECH01006283.1/.p1  ORF type:complete len:729 (+),score=182.39 gb/GECH01006283.1/:1-2187(+)